MRDDHEHSPDEIVSVLERSMPWFKLELRVKNLEYQVRKLMSQIHIDEEGGEKSG